MKLIIVILLGVFVLMPGCTSDKQETRVNAATGVQTFAAVEVKEENTTPTVDIEKYTLIADAAQNRGEEAKAILAIKRKWPLVMQSPSVAGFDSLLARNFLFTEKGHLFTREAYIQDRTKPSEWEITHVKYEDVTLQFFGDMALLTYKNQVRNENTTTKEIEMEYITWVDVYEKENGQWKLAAAHVIDFRIETK